MLLWRLASTVAAFSIVSLVPTYAHPGEMEPKLTPRQLEEIQAAANARHAVARKCDNAFKSFEAQRRAKRSAMSAKRNPIDHPPANVPTYPTLQNTTCVQTPESVEGPYYIHKELFRTDIRDGMVGVPLLLDIGVMDVTTCTPLKNALVDIWSCNATGIYSGFIASQPTVGPPNYHLPVTDQKTFGRGAYPTNENGLVEFSTIFPGFYPGRSVHIHTIVLTDYDVNRNGTIGLEAGHVRHTGQIYFEESWTKLVVSMPPYNSENITRVTNDQDTFFPTENTAGYNATAQLNMLGNSLSDGILGYVTLGVDPSASYNLTSTAYYTGNRSNHELIVSISDESG